MDFQPLRGSFLSNLDHDIIHLYNAFVLVNFSEMFVGSSKCHLLEYNFRLSMCRVTLGVYYAQHQVIMVNMIEQ